MIKDDYKTVVIFRKDKSNKYADNITAVFPYTDANYRHDMECYAHVGQHSVCSYDWYIQNTKPATFEEYKDLKEELESIGYSLDIKLKINKSKVEKAILESMKKERELRELS